MGFLLVWCGMDERILWSHIHGRTCQDLPFQESLWGTNNIVCFYNLNPLLYVFFFLVKLFVVCCCFTARLWYNLLFTNKNMWISLLFVMPCLQPVLLQLSKIWTNVWIFSASCFIALLQLTRKNLMAKNLKRLKKQLEREYGKHEAAKYPWKLISIMS